MRICSALSLCTVAVLFRIECICFTFVCLSPYMQNSLKSVGWCVLNLVSVLHRYRYTCEKGLLINERDTRQHEVSTSLESLTLFILLQSILLLLSKIVYASIFIPCWTCVLFSFFFEFSILFDLRPVLCSPFANTHTHKINTSTTDTKRNESGK